jgi:SNF2 family DNA or RNA helicase
MGHGLNLQQGGHILVWFGPTYNSELYDQACARLDRQGQTKPVMIYRLLGQKTMDGEVLRVLLSKAEKQEGLMHAVRAKVEFYRKNAVV